MKNLNHVHIHSFRETVSSQYDHNQVYCQVVYTDKERCAFVNWCITLNMEQELQKIYMQYIKHKNLIKISNLKV